MSTYKMSNSYWTNKFYDIAPNYNYNRYDKNYLLTMVRKECYYCLKNLGVNIS